MAESSTYFLKNNTGVHFSSLLSIFSQTLLRDDPET